MSVGQRAMCVCPRWVCFIASKASSKNIPKYEGNNEGVLKKERSLRGSSAPTWQRNNICLSKHTTQERTELHGLVCARVSVIPQRACGGTWAEISRVVGPRSKCESRERFLACQSNNVNERGPH